MEVRRGIVSKTRQAISVSGGSDAGVSTKHHTSFSLDDGTTVIFNSGGPAVIRDGDQIVVAGRAKGKMIRADAYWNLTAHVRGDSGRWSSLAIGVITLLLGVVCVIAAIPSLSFPLDITGVLIIAGLILFFGGFGFYNLYKWLRIRDAVKTLDRMI